MVATGPIRVDPAGLAAIPPPLDIRPDLTQDEVDWLNEQMCLGGKPTVRYVRELPQPPPSGGRSGPSFEELLPQPG